MEKKWIMPAIPKRYEMAALAFFGFFNIYVMRVNLSVAMVAMVNSSENTLSDGSDVETACITLLPELQKDNTSEVIPEGEFNWDSYDQSLIFGAFFYGYVITQMPGGILAERFGCKWIFGIGILITSILTMITPFAARSGLTTFVAVRVVEGLAEGVTYPAINSMLSRWIPIMERSRISTFVFNGGIIGIAVTMALSGILASSNIFGGWPSVFYIFGAVGCVWFIFWAFLVYENPEDHPGISLYELNKIQENNLHKKKLKTPWRAVFTSFGVWALIITHFGQNWGFYTLLTEMPTYLSNILHFNIKENGALSSLPYFLHAVFAAVAAHVADRLRQDGRLTITTIRKIMNSIGFFGPGLCVLLLVFVGCRPVVIVVLLCIAVGLNGFVHSGFLVTHVDLSPELAGTLMGITNSVSNLSGVLAPFVVGQIVTQGQTMQNWGLVFGITSAVYFVAGTIYDLFCSAELQSWSVSTEN